jgi:hypothetical protein
MLDGEEMGAAVWKAIKNVEPRKTDEVWKAVCSAICRYLKENAVVEPGISVTTTNSTGQTTGPGKLS